MTRLGLLLLLVSTPAAAHDMYSEWKTPAGGSCCSGQDCAPSAWCTLDGGGEGLTLNGACIPVPYDKVIGADSPDGKPHICAGPQTIMYPHGMVYCVVLGGGS